MEEKSARWEGKVRTIVAEAGADQIWPFFKDFFNIHKWFPRGRRANCYGVHGVNGEVGCIRLFSSQSGSGSGSENEIKVHWAKEKLTHIDHNARSITYEIIDTNIGYKSYVATFKINPIEGEGGCVIEWTFGMDPIQGSRFQDKVQIYQACLDFMAKNMVEDISLAKSITVN